MDHDARIIEFAGIDNATKLKCCVSSEYFYLRALQSFTTIIDTSNLSAFLTRL